MGACADEPSAPARKLALAAFVRGGFAATAALAVCGNDAPSSIYGKVGGAAFVDRWGHALSAPFTEETAKAAGLLLLIALAPQLIRSAFDGLIVGSQIGLGFMVLDNMIYGFRGGIAGFDLDNVNRAVSATFMHTATDLFSHWVYTGIFCAGLIWLLGRPAEPARRVRGLVLILVAMVAHGVWDAPSGAGVRTIASMPTGVPSRSTAPSGRTAGRDRPANGPAGRPSHHHCRVTWPQEPTPQPAVSPRAGTLPT